MLSREFIADKLANREFIAVHYKKCTDKRRKNIYSIAKCHTTQTRLHHVILTWYDSISDNSIHAIFVIFIVIIYLTQSDPITETINALAIA